jgi:hypothetical protein
MVTFFSQSQGKPYPVIDAPKPTVMSCEYTAVSNAIIMPNMISSKIVFIFIF